MFHGIELTARKRLSHRWMMNGSFNWNSATYHSSPDGYVDPVQVDLFGPNAAPAPTDPTNREFIRGRANAAQRDALDGKALGTLSTAMGRQRVGRAQHARRVPVPSNILAPARTGRLNTVHVLVEPYATSRYDTLLLLDLKAEKRFSLGKLNLVGSIDVFNVTNANTVLRRVTTQNSATANQVLEITGPRVVRVGARFMF